MPVSVSGGKKLQRLAGSALKAFFLRIH